MDEAAYTQARSKALAALREFARGVGTKGFWVANIGAAVLVNAIDYGWGSKVDVGIGSTEFYAAVTVDIGLGVASAGTGAFVVFVLLVAFPGAGPAAVLITFVFGQSLFSLGIAPHLRQATLPRVTGLYEELSHGASPYDPEGATWGAALLR